MYELARPVFIVGGTMEHLFEDREYVRTHVMILWTWFDEGAESHV